MLNGMNIMVIFFKSRIIVKKQLKTGICIKLDSTKTELKEEIKNCGK